MSTETSTTFKDESLLAYYREGKPRRWIASITLALFSWVFYLSPHAFAVTQELTEDERRQEALTAQLEQTSSQRFARRLQDLKATVLVELPLQTAERQRAAEQANFWQKHVVAPLTAVVDGPVMPVDEALRKDLQALLDDASGEYTDALSSMQAVEAQLIERGLPDAALAKVQERQADAISTLENRFTELMTLTESVLQATAPKQQTRALESLSAFLDEQQFRSRQTPFNPDQIPTPNEKSRDPITSDADLQAYLGVDPFQGRGVQVASVGLATGALQGATLIPQGQPVDADLAETLDVQITPAIRELAASLNHNPTEIYAWVHNQIRYIPSYGSIQGSAQTLATQRGNAIDTASLLIALLRASDIPARYAYGTVDIPIDQAMNWVGGVTAPEAALSLLGQGGVPSTGISINGVIQSIRMEHTWVEAFVDFEPSRGVKHREGDHWIPMDASFKQYDFTQGVDLDDVATITFDINTLALEPGAVTNVEEGWVKLSPQAIVDAQLTPYQEELSDYISAGYFFNALGEVVEDQSIKAKVVGPLAAGLPYNLVTTEQVMVTVPEHLRHRFQYQLNHIAGGGYTSEAFRFDEPTVALASKQLALSFRPATNEDEQILESYLPEGPTDDSVIDPNTLPDTLPGYLIDMVAELTLDGEVIHSAPVGAMGSQLRSTLGYRFPGEDWRTSINQPIVGEYRAIGLDLQGVSSFQFRSLETQIRTARLELENGLGFSVDKHRVVGGVLQSVILGYFALNDIQDELAAKQTNAVQYRAPSYGVFQTDLTPLYWFGIPRDVQLNGLIMDVDWYFNQTVTKNYDQNAWVSFNRLIGSKSSSMEHFVPEYLLSTEEKEASAISTIKALTVAIAEGQRIYTIKESNLDSALDGLTLDDPTKLEIRQAVQSGFDVIASQHQIQYENWSGAGYIISDPNTGSAAYRITGGYNGAAVIAIGLAAPYLFAVLAFETGGSLASALNLLAAALVGRKGEEPGVEPADPEDLPHLIRMQELAQQAADEVDSNCTGTCRLPWVRGTIIHKRFANKVIADNPSYNAEISYKDGLIVRYGTKGSVRADAVFGVIQSPKFVVELKTGTFNYMSIREARLYLEHLPEGTPVYPLKVR